MKVIDITQTDSIEDSIKILKFNAPDLDVESYKKQYNVKGHNVLDTTKRQDKLVKVDDGESRTEKVGRIPISFQKKIVSASTSFAFGNPVELHAEPVSENEKSIVSALNIIMDDNKIDSFNRRMCKDILRCTQFAEIWYISEGKESSNEYGFDSKFKIRVMPLSPWDGNKLYPYFDEKRDLIAFSRAFSFKGIDGKLTEYFETYTDEETVIWSKLPGGGGFAELSRTENAIGKIPVIFGKDENVDWADVELLIERLEFLLSNFADTNDYHASPKIFIQGNIQGFAKKGETGAILQGDLGSTAQYLSWDHAPESIRLEIDTLFKLIYSLTQTPDISFESVKGLGNVSGIALKMLFLDAHLKVQDKREIFDDYLQRRINVVKSFIGVMNTKFTKDVQNLRIKPKIVPFFINDEKQKIENLLAANGGQALMSQKLSMAQSGLVDNVESEYLAIQEEAKTSASVSLFPPSN
jgi:SPP1 family phage portal protein